MKPQILIIEDELLIAKQIQMILEKENFSVCGSATNTADAIRLCTEFIPDLILMDINLKGDHDGIDTAIEIRNKMDVPIIFLTAFTDQTTTDRAENANPYGYISKPFKEKDLVIGIKMALNRFKNEKTYRKKLEDENISLIKITEIDPLTQIPNRRRFDKYSEIEWNRAFRHKKPLSIIMIDIDYFKLYNDTYGHQKGDECLKLVAKSLDESLPRSGEIITRYGGEEFAAILPGVILDDALFIAERFKLNIENLKIIHEASPSSNHVTLSQGV
ncbi:MAG: diguanylate cyclase, partial [Spirochaetia bacterium]|nr:diguanylate cyclase [Spirochaetia bacterium]